MTPKTELDKAIEKLNAIHASYEQLEGMVGATGPIGAPGHQGSSPIGRQGTVVSECSGNTREHHVVICYTCASCPLCAELYKLRSLQEHMLELLGEIDALKRDFRTQARIAAQMMQEEAKKLEKAG